MRKAVTVIGVISVVLLGSGLALTQGPESTPMTFFITSNGSGEGADLGGLAGADALCQRLATDVWDALSTSRRDHAPSAVTMTKGLDEHSFPRTNAAVLSPHRPLTEPHAPEDQTMVIIGFPDRGSPDLAASVIGQNFRSRRVAGRIRNSPPTISDL